MWHPPTSAEQELWNAVVAGVRAVDHSDGAGFETAVDRLLRLPPDWTHQVLRDTAGLLVEELAPDVLGRWPLPAAQADDIEAWLPKLDRKLLAALLSGHHRPPAAGVPGDPQNIRHGLLLIACLADAAQVGVGAFVDVALAADSRRPVRRPSGSVPQARLGR
ncbi:hypothetical protein [Micromonospora phytophila]|uniref:hypothetical protein n=1 Tax=Micromonospora phytophila TaxID=709888 RepID=UPI00203028A8|nr:hypothetical protein [Micromonospora phytophila]